MLKVDGKTAIGAATRNARLPAGRNNGSITRLSYADVPAELNYTERKHDELDFIKNLKIIIRFQANIFNL